ncbi:hypothetical protein AMECASPLE_039447 [Ameca splendens]|uniref:Uncharacterized protein n=1 Tax=Ameca splendens TaxID=208324 RepID=A0ABV0Y8V7_9TELE
MWKKIHLSCYRTALGPVGQRSVGCLERRMLSCDLLHPCPHISDIVLLELALQLLLVHLLAVSYLYFKLLLYTSAQFSVSLSKGSFFLLSRSFKSLVIQVFVIGEASHRSCGDGVIYTQVYIVNHTLIHGIDVVSM